MIHTFKASKLFSKLQNRNWKQHAPNTVTDGHNDDQPNTDAPIRAASSNSQVVKNSKIPPYKYYWNSLGLRGPEPDLNANRKILAIGNSFTLGMGVPVENSFIYNVAKELNADYINLSDNFVLTDILDSAKDIIKWYNPHIIYLNETRFIDNASFLAFHMVKEGAKIGRGEMFTLLEDGMSKTLNMFEDVLQYYAPNSKIVWDLNLHYVNNKKSPVGFNFASKNLMQSFTLPVYTYTSNDITIDLGRDGVHPGIEGHKWMTNRLVKILGEYFGQ